MLTALSSTPGLPFGSGSGLAWALLAAGLWLAAAAVRLARFNVLSDAEVTDKTIFHGVPTTLAAGLLVNWFLVCIKYGGPDNPLAAPERFAEGRLFGDLQLGPDVWCAFPWAMIVGALLMVSNLRNKKFGRCALAGPTSPSARCRWSPWPSSSCASTPSSWSCCPRPGWRSGWCGARSARSTAASPSRRCSPSATSEPRPAVPRDSLSIRTD
ncbi:hypothetical protein [Nannocystis pusilla]|uniref:hypothetical protein n=1 Tax=Nannocystis pusilla TaxID=889268 RepID=UPI003B786801